MAREGFTGSQLFVRCTLTVFAALATLLMLVPLVAYKMCEGVVLAFKVTQESIQQVWRTPKG